MAAPFGDPGEFDALARLAAGMLEAPTATLTVLDEYAVRLGGSGVSWPVADEERFLRWVARAEGSNANPLSTYDLEVPDVPGGDSLVGDGLRGAVVLPLRDGGATLGVLAIYAPSVLVATHPMRRRLGDLAAIATRLLVARRDGMTRVAAERSMRIARALGELLRGTDWRANMRVAIDALDVTRAMQWEVTGSAIAEVGTWDRGGRYEASRGVLADTATLLRAIREGEVIPASDARTDPRTSALGDYFTTTHVASQLIVPIRSRGGVIAAIAFEHGQARRWNLDEIRFAAAIGGWLGPHVTPQGGELAALGLAERRVLELVDKASDRVVITDDEGLIVYANASMARMQKTSPSELVGRSVGELLEPEYRDLLGYKRMRRNGSDPMLEQPSVRNILVPDGTPLALEIAGTPLSIEGATYVGFVARDVTSAQQRLDATMASAPVAIAHVALDGQFLRANRAFAELVGRRLEDLRTYQGPLDLAPPPDARGVAFADAMNLIGRLDVVALRAQLVAAPGPFELQYELLRPDGTNAWVDLAVTLVRDQGRPAYFVAIAHEITARRRTEHALRRLAETLSLTGDALYAGACELLATTLRAKCVLVGRIEGSTVIPIAGWLDGAPFVAPSYPLVGTPCETVRHAGLCYYPERLQTLFPDDAMLGELGLHSYLGAPLRDDHGRVLGVLAVLGERPFEPALPAEDITRLCATRISTELQRVSAGDELATREEQLRQITESAQEVFWLTQWPSRQLIYVSPAFETLTGRTIASVYASRETWGSNLHPDDRDRVTLAMQDIETAPVDLQARVIRSDGQLRWIQIRASIVRDLKGAPYRIAGSFEDITAVKQALLALEDRERQLHEALASSERELEHLQQRLGEHDQLQGMVGASQQIRAVYRKLRQAAQGDVTVLIAGESGTGKELAANALHSLSARAGKPFIAINCAAIPEPLLESELFGHVKGAFTGASRDKVGLMQAAEGGTLFLDEIGDMSPVLQVKLLRALQERQVRRVGDERAIPIDVRLVSASHRDLRSLVASGRMREDFYYRIKVFEVEMPALRDRREDIASLATHFAQELGRAAGKPRLAISAEAMRALLAHRWPGNVRELRNAIEHALVTVSAGAIQLHDLPLEVREGKSPEPAAVAASAASPSVVVTPNQPTNPVAQREQIEEALRKSGGNRAEAARLLGIGRVTLWKRMRRLGMTADDTDAA